MRMGRLEKFFVNRPGHSAVVARHAEARLRRVPVHPDQTYLDVGCGNGEAAIHVARVFGLAATGVDVDPAQIAAARASSPAAASVRFLTGDSRQLPFEDEAFDFVASNKMTHHVPEWQEAVREMIRVLKPGGHLLYSDLVFPRLLAVLGRAILGRRSGFPTRSELAGIVAAAQLATVQLSRNPLSLTGTFKKRA